MECFLEMANHLEKEMWEIGDKYIEAILREEIRKRVIKYLSEKKIFLKKYPLPVGPGRWEITQGNVTPYTHKGQTNRFCWDFERIDRQGNFHPVHGRDHKKDPSGSYSIQQPVYAVDSGKLILGFRDPDNDDSSNIIVIKHDDGTKAIYDHIDDNGFIGVDYERLKERYAGKYHVPRIRVKQGELIGYIGYTGTPYAHLHFSVKYKELGNLSLPVEFEEGYGVLLENEVITV